LLTKASEWFEIDYATVDDPNAAGTVSQTVLRNGVGHGILVWFEAWIDNIEHFSGGPDSGLEVYGHLFYPWTKSIELRKGDRVELKISARSAGDRYYWSWSTLVESPVGQEKARFQQTTFNTESPSPRQLKKAASATEPAS